MFSVTYKNEYENTRIDPITAYQERNSTILIMGEINDKLALDVVSQIDYFYKKNPEKELKILINSPGGSISAGMMIVDYLNSIPVKKKITGIGMCASMGSFILTCCGDNRIVYPNCQLMYHQPIVMGLAGQASDIEIQAKHILDIKKKLNEELSAHSNLSYDEVQLLFDRDSYITPEKSIEYGLIDGIVGV